MHERVKEIVEFGEVGALTDFFALGGFDDLCEALEKIKPKITIPMHHALPGCKFPKMLDVKDFTSRFPAESVVWCEGEEVEVEGEVPLQRPQSHSKPQGTSVSLAPSAKERR